MIEPELAIKDAFGINNPILKFCISPAFARQSPCLSRGEELAHDNTSSLWRHLSGHVSSNFARGLMREGYYLEKDCRSKAVRFQRKK